MQSHSSSSSQSTPHDHSVTELVVLDISPENYLHLRELATKLFRDKQYEAALKAFDQIISLYEDDIEVRHERIQLLVEMERYKLALDACYKLLESYLSHPPTLALCSSLTKKLAQLEQQETHPDEGSIKQYLLESKSFLNSALIARKQNKIQENTLKEQYIHLFKHHFLICDTTLIAKQFPQIEDKAALVTYAENPSEQMKLGYHLFEAKKYVEAIFLFTQVIHKTPYDFYALTYRAIAYNAIDQTALAFEDLNNALVIRPYSFSYRYRAELFFQLRILDKARGDIVNALLCAPLDSFQFLNTDPFRDTALRLLADELNQNLDISTLTDKEKTLHKLHQAIVENPLSHVAYSAIADFHLADQQYTQACFYYSLALWTSTPAESLDYHLSRSQASLQSGILPAAVFDMEQACQSNPSMAQNLKLQFSIDCQMMAKRYLQQEPYMPDLAIEYLTLAKNTRPTDPSIDIDLAIAHRYNNNLPVALTYALQADSRNPNHKSTKELISYLKGKIKLSLYSAPMRFELQELPEPKPTIAKKNITKQSPSTQVHSSFIATPLPDGILQKKKHTKKDSAMQAHKQALRQKATKLKEWEQHRKAILSQQESDILTTPSMGNPSPIETLPAITIEQLKAIEDAEKVTKDNAEKARKEAAKQKQKDKKREKRLAHKSSHSSNESSAVAASASSSIEDAASCMAPESSEIDIPLKPEVTPPCGIKIKLPESAYLALQAMKHPHHTSFVVGGMPRDILRENRAAFHIDAQTKSFTGPDFLASHHAKVSDDIDIVTTLSEDELRTAFPSGLEKTSTVKGLFRLNIQGYKIEIYLSDALKISLASDSALRDFTCNALYIDSDGNLYDPTSRSITDILCNTLATVQNAAPSLREDSIRILRAIYFASKCAFQLCDELQTQIACKKLLLPHQDTGKLNVWFKKLFLHGHAEENFVLLNQHGIFQELFPTLSKALESEKANIVLLLQQTDSHAYPSLARIYRSFIATALPHLSGMTEDKLIKQNRLLEQEINRQMQFHGLFRSPQTHSLPISASAISASGFKLC